jgi:hypothetical protein
MPAERRNFVMYYHEADLQRVREHLADKGHRGHGISGSEGKPRPHASAARAFAAPIQTKTQPNF